MQQLVIVVHDGDPVALADTRLCLAAQTVPAVMVPAGTGREGDARWVLDLQAGDMLIADAVERLHRELIDLSCRTVELATLAQRFSATTVRGVTGRSATGPLTPAGEDDRRLVVRRQRSRPRGPWPVGEKTVVLGPRPYGIVSRSAD